MTKAIIVAVAAEGLKGNDRSIIYFLSVVENQKLEEMKKQEFDMERFLKSTKGIQDSHLYSLAGKYNKWRKDHRRDYDEIELYFDLQKDSLHDNWGNNERSVARIRPFSKMEVNQFMESLFDILKQ
jgi:hypothetical protein